MLLPQVLRKRSYKGSVSSGVATLPVDGATALGIVQVLASVLPANALQSSAIERCHDIMSFVTRFMDVTVTLQPLGKRSECELDVRKNMMNAMHLQAVLKRVGLQWSRQGLGLGFDSMSHALQLLKNNRYRKGLGVPFHLYDLLLNLP